MDAVPFSLTCHDGWLDSVCVCVCVFDKLKTKNVLKLPHMKQHFLPL